MKKFLFSIVALLCLTAFSANAQIISYSQTKITKIKREKVKKDKSLHPITTGFQQSVELEFGVDIDRECANLGFNYIAGKRIKDFLFIGGGIGVGYACSNAQARLFVNTKLYIVNKDKRVLPFFDISIGGVYGNYYNDNDDYDEGMLLGVAINPQFGIAIRTATKSCINLSLGAQLQPIHENYYYPQLKIGISF